MAVGVQPALPMVNAMVVLAVRPPEVPVMVTVDVPEAAELPAVSVSTLDAAVGLALNDADTPEGRPDAARVTLPVKPFASATEIVSVPLLPGATDKPDAEGESVKLPPDPVTVTTKVCVLTHELALTYVATNVLTPMLNGIPSVSRLADVNPLGPVQLQVPPRGCGPRLTMEPEATVMLAISCQVPPFT